jgi:hypothetical protein
MENDNKQMQTTNGTELAATASAAMAKAEIESAYVMAMKRPRNWMNVRAQILAACERPVFAEKAEYQKPMGGSKINGPSIRFAETVIQAAGNIKTSATVIYDDENIRKVHVQVIDLENNISYGKEITLAKTVERKQLKQGQEPIATRLNSYGQMVYIVPATEDELLVKQAAQESKIIRTCGLRMIPQDIVEEAMEVARATRKKNIDPKAETNKILDAFAKMGVKPSDVSSYLKKPIEQIVAADIDDLRQIYTAIKDGDARWADFLEDAEIVDGNVKEDANAKLARLKKEADAKKVEKPADKPAEASDNDPKAATIANINTLRDKLGMKDKTTVFAATVKAIEPAIEGKTLNDMSVEQLENIASMLAEMLEKKGK